MRKSSIIFFTTKCIIIHFRCSANMESTKIYNCVHKLLTFIKLKTIGQVQEQTFVIIHPIYALYLTKPTSQ